MHASSNEPSVGVATWTHDRPVTEQGRTTVADTVVSAITGIASREVSDDTTADAATSRVQ